MKKIILIVSIFFATQAKSQKVDSVRSAIQVVPYVIDAIKKDTVFQFTVSIFDFKINDTLQANSYVSFYDRNGRRIKEENYPVPFSVLSGLPNHSVIWNYIIQITGLTKRE